MSENNNESFVRWQGRAIQQMGFLNNLLIGLTTGLLAFQTQIAFDKDVALSNCEKWFVILSLSFLFLSLVLGLYLAWNRLNDFRLTAQVARKREKDDREGISDKRQEYKVLGRRTWVCIWLQAITFAFGSLALLIVTIMRYLK